MTSQPQDVPVKIYEDAPAPNIKKVKAVTSVPEAPQKLQAEEVKPTKAYSEKRIEEILRRLNP